MHRRPWPIVILAAYQILSPLLGILGTSLIHGISPFVVMSIHWDISSNLQLLETYILPVVVGLALYSARRPAYFFCIAACIYFIYRNTVEFGLTHQEFPIWLALWANLAIILFVIYLLAPRVRIIYFDSSLRWWENAPRFVLQREAKLTQGNGVPIPVQLTDLSLGGAGLETPGIDVHAGDEVLVEFENSGKTYLLKGTIAYMRPVSPEIQRLGMRWSASKTHEERSRIHRLVRRLSRAGVPTTSRLPYWWDDFKDWARKASLSSEAWLPPVSRKK